MNPNSPQIKTTMTAAEAEAQHHAACKRNSRSQTNLITAAATDGICVDECEMESNVIVIRTQCPENRSSFIGTVAGAPYSPAAAAAAQKKREEAKEVIDAVKHESDRFENEDFLEIEE